MLENHITCLRPDQILVLKDKLPRSLDTLLRNHWNQLSLEQLAALVQACGDQQVGAVRTFYEQTLRPVLLADEGGGPAASAMLKKLSFDKLLAQPRDALYAEGLSFPNRLRLYAIALGFKGAAIQPPLQWFHTVRDAMLSNWRLFPKQRESSQLAMRIGNLYDAWALAARGSSTLDNRRFIQMERDSLRSIYTRGTGPLIEAARKRLDQFEKALPAAPAPQR